MAVLIGVIAGTVGYWVTTFWMKPILQYRELRTKVFADLIFYAQVVSAEGLNERMKTLYEERITSNRRHSAELAACISELPAWYKWWLRCKGHKPEQAVTQLMGFSNTSDYEVAAKRIRSIKAGLGISSDFI